MSMTQQESVIVVDSRSGKKVKADKPFILVLEKGEDLFEGILRCANDADLLSATISGLGGLCDINVAFYNTQSNEYETALFTAMHELISINGNITFSEGNRFLHIHAALGNAKHEVVGGHIMSATVNPTAEITVIPLAGKIERKWDKHTGLKLICPLGY